MKFRELAKTRYSCRKFLKQSVEEDKIEALLDVIHGVFDEQLIRLHISLFRPLIREPNLPNRWKNGNLTPSACISCNTCCNMQGHECIFKL